MPEGKLLKVLTTHWMYRMNPRYSRGLIPKKLPCSSVKQEMDEIKVIGDTRYFIYINVVKYDDNIYFPQKYTYIYFDQPTLIWSRDSFLFISISTCFHACSVFALLIEGAGWVWPFKLLQRPPPLKPGVSEVTAEFTHPLEEQLY